MRIDHVIWATSDLDATAARFEAAHGIVVGPGGRHAGHGTHNRIAPLGGGYLEIVAIADAAEAARSGFGRAVAAAGDGLFGWAAAVEDVDAHAARLALSISHIERDGMRARLAGVAEAMARPWLPFFIERERGIADPGAGGDAGGIAWLELCGDESALWGRLGGAPLPLHFVHGEPAGVRTVGLGDGRELR